MSVNKDIDIISQMRSPTLIQPPTNNIALLMASSSQFCDSLYLPMPLGMKAKTKYFLPLSTVSKKSINSQMMEMLPHEKIP